MIGFERFAVYVFDYGAPTGFRIASKHPDRITAIISQNGNAYEEGLSEGWNPDPRLLAGSVAGQSRRAARLPRAGDDALAIHPWRGRRGDRLSGRLVARQLLSGAPRRRRDPAGPVWRLQEQRRALSGLPELLPHAPAAAAGGVGQERPVLPAAGRGGVQARHSRAVVRFFDTGHFALETHADEIAAAIREFLASLMSYPQAPATRQRGGG